MTVFPDARGAPLRGRLYRRVVFAGAQGAAREKCIPGCKGVQAPCGARVRAAIGLAPWAAQVPPTERAGSEGSYKCGLPAAVVGAFKNERRHDDKTIQPPCGRGKTSKPPCGRGNAPLLLPSAASLHGKASHAIFRSLLLPYKSRSLATPEGEICSPLSFCSHKHLKA